MSDWQQWDILTFPFWTIVFAIAVRLCLYWYRLEHLPMVNQLNQKGTVPQLESGSKLGYLFSTIEDNTLFLDVSKDQGLGDVRSSVVFPMVGRANERELVREWEVRSVEGREVHGHVLLLVVIPKRKYATFGHFIHYFIDASVHAQRYPISQSMSMHIGNYSFRNKNNPTPWYFEPNKHWPGYPGMVFNNRGHALYNRPHSAPSPSNPASHVYK